MTRNLRFLGSGILGLASLAASAGPPGTVPPTAPASATTATLPLGTQPTVAAPSGATAMVPQLTAPADGNLHVSVSVNVNLSGLSPFATAAALACTALINEDGLVTSWASQVNANTGIIVSEIFDTTSVIRNRVWNQTFNLPLRGGLYRGVQTAAFAVSSGALGFQSNGFQAFHKPALLFGCYLQVGNGSTMSAARLHTSGPELATTVNFDDISEGSTMFAVTQDITLKPLT